MNIKYWANANSREGHQIMIEFITWLNINPDTEFFGIHVLTCNLKVQNIIYHVPQALS